MKQINADRLLHFYRREPRPFRLDIADLYVAPMPELTQILFWVGQKPAETLTDNTIQRPFRTGADVIGNIGFRGVVNHVLCKADWTCWFSSNCEDNLTRIRGMTGFVMPRTVRFKLMVDSTSHVHLTSLCAVGENDATAFGLACTRLE